MSIRHEKLPVAALERIDDRCAAFETAWRRGERPEVESALGEVEDPSERSALLAELIVLDCDYRRQQGEQPAAQEYCDRFPQDAGLIEKAFDEGLRATGPPHQFVPPTAAHVGELFPNLEVLELIGAGGMGAVYKARQTGLDRLVAVKILPDEVGRDVKFALRFTREARVLAKMNHPNIVSVYEFGRAGDTYFFLMEFVDGSTLRDLIQAHELSPEQLSPEQTLAIVPCLCDALQYAHDQGIVHRDIKPENILIDRRGQVKVADFGLSRLLGHETGEDRLTGTHQVMGTPRYMAPEQLEGTHHVDHRADIYSLGVVIYEMLTGELPIGRFAVPSKKAQIDIRIDEVVLRTLEKEPQRRYQHASDIKTDVVSINSTPRRGVASTDEGNDRLGDQEDRDRTVGLRRQELAARVLVLRRQLLNRVEVSLKPLFWGQIIQMFIGIVFIALGVACWAPNQDVPHRLISGIVLHVYGALMIIAAGVSCARIRRLDYTKPLAEIRQQLDALRDHYLRAGGVLGLSWWLLWIPLCVAIGLEAVVYPLALWISSLIGAVGLIASFVLYRKILRSDSPTAQRYARALSGESLSNAYLALDEINTTEMS